jgi:hypothetical protein
MTREMKPRKSALDEETLARIDRLSRDLMSQVSLQTEVALNLSRDLPEARRQALLEPLTEIRARLLRLRAEVLGVEAAPKLVASRTRARKP